jgi:6-phosphofructokinase 1
MPATSRIKSRLDPTIEVLGPAKIDSPMKLNPNLKGMDPSRVRLFVQDTDRTIMSVDLEDFKRHVKSGQEPVSFEMAGPREKIYFDPTKVKAAIVTAGGLCPGLNDVIRSIVLTLYHIYGVRNILGVKYGFQGLIPSFGHDLVELNPRTVSDIHDQGGSILSSSRGLYSVEEIVDSLERLNINILFTIGGDGTLRGSNQISEEITRRKLKIAVVGVPKTIDNDINLVARSFGFDTATDTAAEVIRSAHAEATGAPNGVGLVKLMGRDSGFIAANAALAEREVNFVLIPEADFDLDGPDGLLAALEVRLKSRGHAVIVVAEGAGQKFFSGGKNEFDASGNRRLGDIGVFLADRIKDHFKKTGMELNLKYIDPSYLIRSRPASSSDSIFCGFLGAKAVHAAMAGKTKLLVSQWNNVYVHVPIREAIVARKKVELSGLLWHSVLESTGQPSLIGQTRTEKTSR